MKRFHRLILAIAAFYLLIISNPSYAEPTLWKIQSDKAEIYLFGSIHVGKPEMYPFSAEVNQAFNQSENLVLEIDLLSSSMVQAVAWMYLNARLPNDQTLNDVMKPQSISNLQAALKNLKLPYSSVENLKPWMVGMNLEMLMMLNQNYKAELGVDIHFAQRALASRKNVLELESPAEQFAYFDNLSMEQQVFFLDGILEQLDDSSKIVEQMVELWMEGNQKEFETLIISEMLKDPKQQFFYDIFLKKRNIKMADKIAGFLETGGSYFVVVGAAHYLGEDSIIKYLEKKGVMVKTVN